jgi:hypothetical protein
MIYDCDFGFWKKIALKRMCSLGFAMDVLFGAIYSWIRSPWFVQFLASLAGKLASLLSREFIEICRKYQTFGTAPCCWFNISKALDRLISNKPVSWPLSSIPFCRQNKSAGMSSSSACKGFI